MKVNVNVQQIEQLQLALRAAQAVANVVRGITAAIRAGGGSIPDDSVLIGNLASNSEAGQADADAVIENLRAQLPAGQ